MCSRVADPKLMVPLAMLIGVIMEAPEMNNVSHQVKVFSQSPLHLFITGPEALEKTYKSKTNPYRRRQGLFSFLGLGEVIEELKKDDLRAASLSDPLSEF